MGAPHSTEFAKSIKLLLLKAKPTEDLDITDLRQIVKEQFDTVSQQQMINLTVEGQETPCIEDFQEDNDPFFAKLEEFNNFIDQVSGSLDIFDPLDRDIPSEDNHAIKRYQLKQQLRSQVSIDAKLLRAPLSNELRNSLLELIMNEQKKCVDIMRTYTADATARGHTCNRIFKRNETVIALGKNLEFLCENEFLENAGDLQEKFNTFVEDA